MALFSVNGIMPADTRVSVSSDQLFFLPGAHGYLTVPAGAVSAAFSLPTTPVPRQIIAHISANVVNYVTDTVTAPLTINLTNRGRRWNLNNVVFKDGGRASGYFVYDPATAQYLAVNIQVTQGNPPDPTSPLGQDAQQFHYYPSPSDRPTFVNNGSTASLMALQNPVTSGLGVPNSWTLLQFNFRQPLTNAGGTIPLVIDPNVAYTPYCAHNPSQTCTPPPTNISQELFTLPESQFNVPPAWVLPRHRQRERDGSVTEEAKVEANTKPPITLPPQYEPRVAGVDAPGYSLYRISPTARNSDPSGRSRLKR